MFESRRAHSFFIKFYFLMHEMKEKKSSLGGLEPPTFRLRAERANRLRHRDSTCEQRVKDKMACDRIIHIESLEFEA